jgi:DNA polymerase III epsilon subunit-like protein
VLVTIPPESYVDSMPADGDLLVELGRVTWAAARLHAGVRDAINRHHGAASDAPFTKTLGQAVTTLEQLARSAGRTDQLDWVALVGRQSVKRRNAVIHAVTYTASDGKQAMGTVDHSRPGRFLAPDLREVTLHLIHASMTLPN